MSNKWGKRNAFIVSTILSIIGYLLKWWGFSPENPWLIFMPVPFYGIWSRWSFHPDDEYDSRCVVISMNFVMVMPPQGRHVRGYLLVDG